MSRGRDERALFGRARELARLQRVLDGLGAKRGGLVLIEGEAGIGKTSLALAFGERARAGGAVFAIGRCYEIGVSRPFAPWHDLIEDLGATLSLQVAALPPPFGLGPAPQSAYHAMQAIVALLRSAATRPLVLLLDDLHWADRDTLELLDLATRRLESIPILFILTYRGESLRRAAPLYDFLPQLKRDRPSDTISLRALDPAAILELVEAAQGPCSPQLATFLHTRTDGNPLFLGELLQSLAEQQALPRDAAGRLLPPEGNVAIPAMLRQVIRGRIEHLGDPAVEMLEVAAVVGEEWDLRVVEELLGWPEQQLLDTLEAAVQSRVVLAATAGGERYRFSHGLLREVLYDGQLARRRRNLHHRVGEVLEALPPATRATADTLNALAYHFWAADDWGRTLRYSLAAGDAARQRFAFHTAQMLYQQALDALGKLDLPNPQASIDVYERLGQTRTMLRRQEQAEAAFTAMREAARASDDSAAEGRALFWLSFIRTRLYQVSSARSTGEAALRVAEEVNNPRLRALAHWTIGHVDKISGEVESAERHMLQAEELARASGSDDVRSWALLNLSQLALFRCAYQRAEALAREALALGRMSHDSIGISGACWALGMAQGELGLYDQARHALQAGIEQARQADDRHHQARLLNTIGWLQSELGDWDTAMRLNQESLDVARGAPSPSDRIAEAERYALLNLASGELAAGRLDACEQRIREFEHLLGRSEYARFRYLNRYQLLRAEASLAQGKPERAIDWAEQACDLATSKGNQKNQTRAELLTGRAWLALDKPREALAAIERASQRASAIEHCRLRWETRFWLGNALATLGQSEAAAAAYREALAQVEAIAGRLENTHLRDSFLASPLVQQVRDAAAAPTHASERPAAIPAPAGLTRREIEVLRLVTQGATNAAIAQTLSISVRTVDVHLTNIFSKTGCDNRAAAVAFALRHGIA